MKIYLVGVGMGNPDTLTAAAQRAVEGSGLLIGAPRLLEPFAHLPARRETLILAEDIAAALRAWEGEQAAVLLSGFTADWRGLLIGVNVGGLGTPIASLASLISLKLYLHTPGARGGRYLALFTGINVLFLALLFALAAWLLHTL